MANNIIGTAPNQVPTNNMLGTMAYQDAEGVHANTIQIDTNMINGGRQCDISYSYQNPGNNFSILITNTCSTLLLEPANPLTNGVIGLPSGPFEGQQVGISTTLGITTITINPGGSQTVKNAPTTLAAGAGFGYIYRQANTAWFRLY